MGERAALNDKVESDGARIRSDSVVYANQKMTSAVVLPRWQVELFQRVAALRAARGEFSRSEGGVVRPYSVSALIRDLLETHLTELSDELRAVGIDYTPPVDGANDRDAQSSPRAR